MRARAFYLLLLSLLSPVAAQAQANGIVGSWSGSVQLNGATYWSAVVFQPDGRFSEQLRMGTLMTLTTGRYEWLDRNTIHLTVEDWSRSSSASPPPDVTRSTSRRAAGRESRSAVPTR